MMDANESTSKLAREVKKDKVLLLKAYMWF